MAIQWKPTRPRRRRRSPFAPAVTTEPVAARGERERLEVHAETEPFAKNPTGAWADGRTAASPDARGARPFIDPGSFALQNHVSPLMESASLPVGALGGASADLDSAPAKDPGGGDDGKGGGASGGYD